MSETITPRPAYLEWTPLEVVLQQDRQILEHLQGADIKDYISTRLGVSIDAIPNTKTKSASATAFNQGMVFLNGYYYETNFDEYADTPSKIDARKAQMKDLIGQIVTEIPGISVEVIGEIGEAKMAKMPIDTESLIYKTHRSAWEKALLHTAQLPEDQRVDHMKQWNTEYLFKVPKEMKYEFLMRTSQVNKLQNQIQEYRTQHLEIINDPQEDIPTSPMVIELPEDIQATTQPKIPEKYIFSQDLNVSSLDSKFKKVWIIIRPYFKNYDDLDKKAQQELIAKTNEMLSMLNLPSLTELEKAVTASSV